MIGRALSIILLASLSIKSAAEKSKPNIIFLFADDQRPDTIGAHGNPHISTPHLDKLVANGFSFRRNYCAGSFSGAVCVASRAMLMTGRHWMNLDAKQPSQKWGDTPTLPARLTETAGYQSFIIGKWHNGLKTLQRSFSNGSAIYMGGMVDHTDFEVQNYANGKLGPKYKAAEFSSTTFASEAIKYINKEKEDKPFFLYVSFMAPHDTRNPPEKYRQMYYEKRPPLPKNFLPQHPFNTGSSDLQGRDEVLAAWPRIEKDLSDQLCEYYGLITHLDEQVGRIMTALEDSPHADNTVVIYTADHGLALGSHGLLGKQNIYEHSMQCPLIMSGPSIPRGKSSQSFSYVHDLYHTVCDLAKISPPAGIDSESLVPILSNPMHTIHKSLFLPYKDNMRAVNDGRWKLHIYTKVNHTLLFDLEKDSNEINNLAEDPDSQQQLLNMQAKLKQWQKKLGDQSPLRAINPASLTFTPDNTQRYPDKWQPKWICDKYFEGRSYKPRQRKKKKK